MTDANKARFMFKLELNFSRIAAHIDVEDPTLISDRWLNQAWGMLVQPPYPVEKGPPDLVERASKWLFCIYEQNIYRSH
jgi:hypothetical protein